MFQVLSALRCAPWFTAYYQLRLALDDPPLPALDGFHPLPNYISFRPFYRCVQVGGGAAVLIRCCTGAAGCSSRRTARRLGVVAQLRVPHEWWSAGCLLSCCQPCLTGLRPNTEPLLALAQARLVRRLHGAVPAQPGRPVGARLLPRPALAPQAAGAPAQGQEVTHVTRGGLGYNEVLLQNGCGSKAEAHLSFTHGHPALGRGRASRAGVCVN